ncbi:hypothetical protein E2C01_058534 [Portunus trituberculatus]|uniref:Uncharacterized protein n=1 Tax=Portunus trituberculatus TaxID=210409 RepID=A0A5B7H5M6_PORTR|nr:hypothetical protein [Portunus trituberculatus]
MRGPWLIKTGGGGRQGWTTWEEAVKYAGALSARQYRLQTNTLPARTNSDNTCQCHDETSIFRLTGHIICN